MNFIKRWLAKRRERLAREDFAVGGIWAMGELYCGASPMELQKWCAKQKYSTAFNDGVKAAVDQAVKRNFVNDDRI